MLASPLTHSHGWVEFPSARQNTCYLDGGYWNDQIPNAACQAAYDLSGAHPFVQRSEISANVSNYRNIADVQDVVTDGQLCSAGDRSKAGLDLPSPHWQRTHVSLDANQQIELVFYGQAPHNPSYWEFYLSNPDYDATQPLTWQDLSLIDTAGNVFVGDDKRYRIKVRFPADRSGDAILYTRWQRDDAAGEGFYNCSDIRLSGSHSSDPSDATLTSLGYFIPQGFGPVAIDDQIRLRTFDEQGQEQVDLILTITETNQANWPATLAEQFNQATSSSWYIGIWHDEMSHYMFDSANLYANQIWAPDNTFNYALSLIKPPPSAAENAWSAQSTYQQGEKVSHKNQQWQAKWWTQNEEPGTTGEWGVWQLLP
ncbi:Spindolin [Vibrio sp. SM6]|uniref:Spindolin n=1 Tax=Vibrio agarilyticus TaxID=2726741 RepID=A0A7X8YHR1_9VIBR|nr:lytic polysaccharide monooxygenase [Vibrio agarilyticus]NLS13627.1 Spindolin [Vibrio agarilyticus]